MKRWTSPIAPVRAARWQSRAEILKAHLNSLSPAELIMRPDHYAIRFLAWPGPAKAYNPNQPRIPAGSPDGGRWTDTGVGAGGSQLRLAGPVPTNEPPEFPNERPSTAAERTIAVKQVVRLVARFGGPIGRVIGSAYWLYEYEAEIEASLDPPKSLEELLDSVRRPRAGYQKHHIVEQASAERDGYPRTMIDAPDNLVLVPTIRHRDINAWYQTREDEFGGLSPGDYLRGKSWDERRRIGLRALIQAGVLKP